MSFKPLENDSNSSEMVKAIADLKVGKHLYEDNRRIDYDYSHLLPEHAQGSNYRMQLRYFPETKKYSVELIHGGSVVGRVLGDHDEKSNSIDTHSQLDKDYQGKDFGKAMYKAALTHAYHVLGAKEVKGQALSEEASYVHQSLAREHGMDYEPTFEDSYYDNKDKKVRNVYSHPGYVIKSEESAKKNKVVASVAVFNPEGKMLWGVRNDTKKHTLPGGHLEGNESPVKGAVRELFEEAGLIPDELHSLGHDTVDSYDGKHKITVHAFKAICGGEPHSKNDPDKECDKWDWVDVKNNKVPEEILANLHSPKNVVLKLMGMQDWDELTKGSLQSKMRFDPTQADPSSHEDIRDWQMGWAQDRSLIPEMQGEARFRALHKLHGATKARRGPTGEREFLLWRGHGPEMDVSGTHAVTDQRTGWTPDASIAAGFSHAGHMTGAWVPESAIVSIPKQLGQLRVSPYAQPDSKGRLIPKGRNEMAPEYEVVVAPAKMEIAKVVPKEVARGTPIGQLTAEHLLGKSEDLTKMAIADLQVGKKVKESPTSTRFDYSHMLPESAKDGYEMAVLHRNNPEFNVPDLHVYLYHNNRSIGEVKGFVDGKEIEVHSDLNPDYKGNKLGKAMYNAILTHANSLGIQSVKGHRHTGDASKVHSALAREHGFDYNPKVLRAVTTEAGPTPTLFTHTGYTIKSEQEVNLLNVLSKAEKLLDLLKSDKIHSTSDATVMDINRAPAHHLDSEYYRITPKVASAYEQYGRGGAVKNAQYISDPEPSIGGGVVTGYDNPEDLHHYIKNTYEPFLTGKVLPQSPDKPVVFLAPVPIRSMHHGNHSPYLSIDHLHGVAVATDKRGRVPFYYSIAKKNLEQGHPHPLVAPLIVNYEAKPNDSHQLSVVDGNGRSVSARTAGATHMLAYVQMKHEAVPHFLKMLHDTANNPEGRVRTIMNAPNLPSEFHVHQIPNLLDNVQKSELVDRVERLLDGAIYLRSNEV